MSAAGTAKAKGIETKSAKDAQTAAAKMGAVIVPTGNGGSYLVNKAEAERRKLIDAAKAELEATELKNQQAGEAEDAKVAKATHAKQTGKTVEAATVVEAPAVPVKVKAPYNPSPLAGAPEPGKAPSKGQLPLALLRKLVERNPNSEKLRAALAAAEGGATAPAKKAKKAKK